ncbi:MAG TPA: hypothetical protein VMS93_09100 [Candidatus Saccharimonadales bacterium]|nr:hypothetical protein [Candidatus Saccharimonadales bacterium]
MNLYRLALYVHLFVLTVLAGAAGASELAHGRLRRARTVGQAREWASVLRTVKPMFPYGALLLLVSGGYMVGQAFKWTDGWVLVSAIGLVATQALGAALVGRWGKGVGAALGGPPDAPLSREARAAILDPAGCLGHRTIMGLVLGIMLLMVTKPPGPASAVIAVAAAALGAASSLPILRSAAEPAAPPAIPAGDEAGAPGVSG